MVANFVAVLGDLGNGLRMFIHEFADQEKGGGGLVVV
jgi:hypothetical protein